jgi:UDP-glucuronate 4-epimerase
MSPPLASKCFLVAVSVAAGVLLGCAWKACGEPTSRPEYYSEPQDQVRDRAAALARNAKSKQKNVVLVTGAAGFVGFHTALQLHEEGDAVIGLDNFNSYYDVRLKRARAALLRRAGMNSLFEGDVCDADLLKTILRAGRVTHVIHLAAQAGVRYSLKKPLAYVEANVRCFVTLLEAVHAINNSVPITYASSSSVYGINKKIPFSEQHQVDSQASLYGATKKSNENIAHVYHHLHGLRLTGLRFFTVYGPLGRPDMAYFGFTDSILAGKGITEFRNADGTELQRDFTYITDIVDGVVSASRRAAALEVFNLGNTHPERVSSLIGYIEEGLGRQANVSVAPITAGDVPLTYADVSHARKELAYQPKVSLANGVRRFLQWYSAYYRVPLPSSMAPTRRESFELRQKYDIPAPLTGALEGGQRRGVRTKRRMMAATSTLQRSP